MQQPARQLEDPSGRPQGDGDPLIRAGPPDGLHAIASRRSARPFNGELPQVLFTPRSRLTTFDCEPRADASSLEGAYVDPDSATHFEGGAP